LIREWEKRSKVNLIRYMIDIEYTMQQKQEFNTKIFNQQQHKK